jgi:cyclophilin family peptidyl-prolyl cis-trans isomerase
MELYNDKAPITVENFLQYVRIGFYDYLIFHRVIPGFMIQGGGFYIDENFHPYPEWTDPPIINESYNGLSNLRGTVAMARTNEPNSATSQFFINLVDNVSLDRKSPTNVGYCVFANVISGMDVVDDISVVGVVTSPIITGEISYPYPQAVGIISAKILTPGYWLNVDLNNDGIANLTDFAYFAANWKKTGSNLWGDLNQNNTVNMPDLYSFSQGWLHKTNWYTIDGDINGDKTVNLVDFAQICNQWGMGGKRIQGDLNNDWYVDYLDLLFLAEHWLDKLQ